MQILATFDADAQPVGLTPSDAGDVTLFWKRQDDGAYAAALHAAKMADIAGWDATALALNRVQSVTVADPAAGQTLASYALASTDDITITATPTFAAIPLATIQAQQLAALQVQYDTRRQSPMTWNFGAIDAQDGLGADKGPAGSQQLDVSDPSAKNWLVAQAEAAAYIAAGAGTTLTPICAMSGLWIQTTAAQAEQVLFTGDGTQTSMAARERAMMVRFTALRTQINAAADAATCLAIDVTAGWPA